MFSTHSSSLESVAQGTSLNSVRPTFQRQGLPYPKLLEHDNKQSDNNNNGNYFHAIQFHGCLALDATCTVVLFKKQLFKKNKTKKHLFGPTPNHLVSLQTTIFFLRLLHFLLGFLCRHQLLHTLKWNPWLKPLTTQKKKNIIKAIRPTRPPLSKPVPGPSCALCYQMKNSPGLNLQNSPKVIFARGRCSSVSARQHFGLIFRICPTALSSQPLHPPAPTPL